MTCGICKREGEAPELIRLADEDMRDEKYPSPKLPGLYRCCTACFDTYRPLVARRLDLPEDSPGNLLV